MDLLIPENWLKEFLDSKANATEIAKYLSLCGPSIERINKVNNVNVFDVEVTGNRVDSASIYGIAREAATILPKFGIKAKLKQLNLNALKNHKLVKKVSYLNAVIDEDLCQRFTAVLIKNVSIKESPKDIKEKLELVGVRPINNVVDISNYVMHEIGQPVHTFDYDKIVGQKMILRSANNGEEVTTLDGKAHKLKKGDIVIEDGGGGLIDLCGIMGGQSSQIDSNTKNVLLFVQNYNYSNIRQTSMRLAARSEAAVLFEKDLDSENVLNAVASAIDLFEKLTGGKVEKEILDIYPKPYKEKSITVAHSDLENIIGIELSQKEIIETLKSLGFEVKTNKKEYVILIPSYRAKDIAIKEDIVEEIARIYGYHNLPSILMKGTLPEKRTDTTFETEDKIKEVLVGLGSTEVYTLSLVPTGWTSKNSLELKNPLGSDSSNLRTSLMPSLSSAASDNKGVKTDFVLFEVANIYLPKKNDIPEEVMKLGIITNQNFIAMKGIVEILLNSLGIKHEYEEVEKEEYVPSSHLEIKIGKEVIGEMGILENSYLYCEFDIEKLNKYSNNVSPISVPSKYPSQIEDITLTLQEKTPVGKIINEVKSLSHLIKNIELKDIYNNNYTFNIEYQDENKTLTNSEVETLRNKVLSLVKSKFGASVSN